MATEKYATLAVSALASSLSSGATSFAVTSGEGAKFPSSGNFRLLVQKADQSQQEIVLCTARSTDTFTVTRGAEGTTGISHDSGSIVALVLTAAALDHIRGDMATSGVDADLPTDPKPGDTYNPTDTPVAYLRGESAWSMFGPVFALAGVEQDNGEATTLSSSIISTDVAMTLAATTGFVAPCVVLIGTEHILITANVAGVCTITRGYDGTTGAIHTSGDAVTLLNWQWFNKGNVVETRTNAGVALSTAATSGDAVRIKKQLLPSGTYGFVCGFIPNLINQNFRLCGLVLRESSSGRFISFTLRGDGNLEVAKWNSETSFNGDYTAWFYGPMPPVFFFKIEDDGTNRIFSVSSDMVNFSLIFSGSHTDFCTPDEIGLALDANNNSGGAVPAAFLVLHFIRTA